MTFYRLRRFALPICLRSLGRFPEFHRRSWSSQLGPPTCRCWEDGVAARPAGLSNLTAGPRQNFTLYHAEAGGRWADCKAGSRKVNLSLRAEWLLGSLLFLGASGIRNTDAAQQCLLQTQTSMVEKNSKLLLASSTPPHSPLPEAITSEHPP